LRSAAGRKKRGDPKQRGPDISATHLQRQIDQNKETHKKRSERFGLKAIFKQIEGRKINHELVEARERKEPPQRNELMERTNARIIMEEQKRIRRARERTRTALCLKGNGKV